MWDPGWAVNSICLRPKRRQVKSPATAFWNAQEACCTTSLCLCMADVARMVAWQQIFLEPRPAKRVPKSACKTWIARRSQGQTRVVVADCTRLAKTMWRRLLHSGTMCAWMPAAHRNRPASRQRPRPTNTQLVCQCNQRPWMAPTTVCCTANVANGHGYRVICQI